MRRPSGISLPVPDLPRHARSRFFSPVISDTYILFRPSRLPPSATFKSERGSRSPRGLRGFFPGQDVLHLGGSELPVGPLKPLRRFPYVEEVGGENLEQVPSLLVVCG